MSERPKLDNNLDVNTFKEYYYLKEELIDFCRKNDLQIIGGKLELTERLLTFQIQVKIFNDNKDKSLDQAIKCWKYKKSLKGHNKYEKEDLEILKSNYRCRNVS